MYVQTYAVKEPLVYNGVSRLRNQHKRLIYAAATKIFKTEKPQPFKMLLWF